MTDQEGWLELLTSPWTGLVALLVGLSLGTWYADPVRPIQAGVDAGIGFLTAAAPYIILFTILPALVDLFDTTGGRAPVVVLLLFAASSITAGVFAVIVSGLVFQLPLAGGAGGVGFVDSIGNALGDVSASPPILAVFWAFGSAIVLHTLIVFDRVTAETSVAGRIAGKLGYVARQTKALFLKIFEAGVEGLGGLLEYVLPFLLFSVGTFVPVSVRRASDEAAGASSGFSALPWYLGTAALVAVVTTVFLFAVAILAVRLTDRDLGKAAREYIFPVYAFAWSSASSAATIPINLEKADEGLNAREETRGFVIPLGATVNLDGTLIATMLITPVVTKAVGIPLTFGQLAATLIPLLFMTVGAPGLPAGMSFLAPPVIAAVLGLQGDTATAFIGVWFAFSLGLSDQFRTAVNSVNNGFLTLIAERILYGPERDVQLVETEEPTAA